VEQARAALNPDEVLLSFYFGQGAGYVWAVSENLPLGFATIPGSAAAMTQMVKTLREALEPNAVTISDVPAFDLTLAYELYCLLLKPIEPTWGPARNLIVVTNGALGLLPLSLLPTAMPQVDPTEEPAFSGYRKVSWLARSHAVLRRRCARCGTCRLHLPRGKA